MEAAQPHLHLVDLETGEIVGEGCQACPVKDDEIAGLQRDIRGWAHRYAELSRNKEAEARGHALWPVAKELFDYWRDKCGHPRSEFTFDRFELARLVLQSKQYGASLDERVALCRRAIDGAAFDPFTTRRRNGSVKRHDGWSLIFRKDDRDKFEEFACRAPRTA